MRFTGEPLRDSARIAVISNDAIGNSVVVTPLLQGLRAQYPAAEIHYVCGPRTQELWSRFGFIDIGHALLGRSARDLAREISVLPPFDWVINVENAAWAKFACAALTTDSSFVTGACWAADCRGDLPFEEGSRGDLWRDTAWIRAGIEHEYDFLNSPFIGEFFFRLAYLEGQVPKYGIPRDTPSIQIPDVLIAMSASLPDKLWSFEGWMSAVQRLRSSGLTVGLLGAAKNRQGKFWLGADVEDALVGSGVIIDLRGDLKLTEVVGAIDNAKLVLTLDNGIMHLAASTQTPTVALFRNGIHRLWSPPGANVTAVIAEPNQAVSTISPRQVEVSLEQAGY